MSRIWIIAFLVLCLTRGSADAQQTPSPQTPPKIQDNSFLIEEAYNQDFGVVQHISSFTRLWPSRSWTYSFTQEWPAPGNAGHQLSYTLTYLRAGALTDKGIGDLAFNYRYQLVGNGDTRLAFAPRFTVLFPTGNAREERGAGGVGLQTNMPVSWVWTSKLVTHWNAGVTVVPHGEDTAGEEAATFSYNLGQSIIWLVHPRVNLMFETAFSDLSVVTGSAQTSRERALVLNPGVRWAFNLENGLQIVPGIAAPFGVGPGRGDKGVFLYLSFEHPFRKIPK